MRLAANLAILLLILHINSKADNLQLKYLHITALGNSLDEAKSNAYEFGAKRAAVLAASKLAIKLDADCIPNCALRQVFTISEVVEEQMINNIYAADISYQYDQVLANQLFLRYGGAEVANRYYEYLVVPLIKYRGKYVWQSGLSWFETWQRAQDTLQKSGLLYAASIPATLSNDLTTQSLAQLNYQDIASRLPDQLFKKIAIICFEEFNSDNVNKAFAKVDYLFLSPQTRKEETKVLNIVHNDNMQNLVFNKLVNSFVSRYGVAVRVDTKSSHNEAIKSLSNT